MVDSTVICQFDKAIQQCERLIYSLEEKNEQEQIIQNTKEYQQQLKQQKSQYEGTESPIQDDPNAQIIKYPKNSFLELKSHIKGNTLTELKKHLNIKEIIINELKKALEKENRQLVFAAYGISPWFTFTQDDRQSKSRKNSIFFIFRQNSIFTLGIENQHAQRRKDLFSIEGKDEWIVGRELRSFIDLIIKFQHKYICFLSNKENILYETEIWKELCEITKNGSILYNTKSFIQRTKSQAISLISVRDKKQKPKNKDKKNKPSNYSQENTHILSSEAQQDIIYFCDCFHLLFDCLRICVDENLLDWIEMERIKDKNQINHEEISKLNENLSKNQFSDKNEIISLIFKYNQLVRYHLVKTTYKSNRNSDFLLYKIAFELCDLIQKLSSKNQCILNKLPSNYQLELENWLGVTKSKFISSDLENFTFSLDFNEFYLNDHQKNRIQLKDFIHDQIGPPLATFSENQILFLIENGSRMYDLSLPDSDCDFIAIYFSDCFSILSNLLWPKESTDNRGLQKPIEHCCYEIRLFCELLLKGNPSVIELLYSNRITFMTNAWKILIDHRDEFISEQVVFQYVSWVKFHLKLIKSNRNPLKAFKYFYHAFHKLFELERLLNQKSISVISIGEERDFILNVRQSDGTGDFSIDSLMEKAESKLQFLEKKMADRDWRYPESGNWKFLQQWLYSIRKYSIQHLEALK